MREFFDSKIAPGMTIEITGAYAEYTVPLPTGGGLVTYLSTDDERFRLWSAGIPTACSFVIQACVNELLSPYFVYMQDSVHGDEWADVFLTTCPVFRQLYTDSQSNQLDNGGIRWVNDPDVSENKYMIVVAVDNLVWDPKNWTELHKIERVSHALARSLERSVDLAHDLHDNVAIAFHRAVELGLVGADSKQLAGGQRYAAITDAANKVKDWVDFFQKLV